MERGLRHRRQRARLLVAVASSAPLMVVLRDERLLMLVRSRTRPGRRRHVIFVDQRAVVRTGNVLDESDVEGPPRVGQPDAQHRQDGHDLR